MAKMLVGRLLHEGNTSLFRGNRRASLPGSRRPPGDGAVVRINNSLIHPDRRPEVDGYLGALVVITASFKKNFAGSPASLIAIFFIFPLKFSCDRFFP